MLTSYQKIGPFNKRIRGRNVWVPPFNNISKYNNNILKPFSYYAWGLSLAGLLGNGSNDQNQPYPINIVPPNTYIQIIKQYGNY